MNNLFHRRRSIRMPTYDYSSAGAYFVTACTQGRECVLSDPIVAGIILDVWESLPTRFPTIAMDEFVIMPNHIHFVVWLQAAGRGDPCGRPSGVFGRPSGVYPDGDYPNPGVANGQMQNGQMQNRQMQNGHGQQYGQGQALPLPAPVVRDWVVPTPTVTNVKPVLGDVVGAFKSLVFTVYLDWIKAHNLDRQAKFWQRNYFEHVVRNDRELHAIQQYIVDNPAHWDMDRDNLQGNSGLPVPTHIRDYLADLPTVSE